MFIGKELIWDSRLSKWDKLYIRIFGVPINGLRIRARRILPLLDGNFPHRILDAGCGLGVFCFEIAKRFQGAQVVGIDLDKAQIEANNQIAQKAGLSHCRFEVGDVSQLTAREKFDLVLSIDVIEHIEDDIQACRNLYQALSPGGRLIMHVPAMYRRWIFFRKRLNFWEEKEHARPGYSLEGISEKLEMAGFVIDKIGHTYGYLETVTNNIANIISRSNKENKYLYALAFPVLLFISYWGKFSKARDGSGIFVVAHR